MIKGVKQLSHIFGWLRYTLKFKRAPKLSEPHNLNEKIMWLSRHADTRVWSRLSDKWAVRQYVKWCGLGNILVPAYQHSLTLNGIDYESLPAQFVIKPTSGSGNVVVVRDKSAVSFQDIKSRLKHSRWFGLLTGEPHYLDIAPGYVVEELLPTESEHGVIDYKIWCFNGKAHSCLVCADRNISRHEVKLVSYSLPDWQKRPDRLHPDYRNNIDIPKPEHLNEMIEISEKLSAGFPCVRVDLYEVNSKVYFGEMTFTSNGGRMRYFTDDFLLEMGKCIDLGI